MQVIKFFIVALIFSPSLALAQWSPEDFIRAANNETLIYQSRGLMSGSDSVKSCVFRNSQVIVVYDFCLDSQQEAPALGIKIIRTQGGMLDLYIENSDGSGKISQARRKAYDRNWRVSHYETSSLSLNSATDFKSVNAHISKNKGKPYCFVGGMMSKTGDPFCSAEVSSMYKNLWLSDALEFWKSPPEIWYELKKKLRKNIGDL